MAKKSAKKPSGKPYVEYSSNNSGGRWWLSDDDWRALEGAGWKVAWSYLEYDYNAQGNYKYDDDGTPKLKPLVDKRGLDKDGRWLGALAKAAFKAGARSVREAADEWQRLTKKSPLDAGCPCCGQPHNFTLYRDGKHVESGPSTSYEASWS